MMNRIETRNIIKPIPIKFSKVIYFKFEFHFEHKQNLKCLEIFLWKISSHKL